MTLQIGDLAPEINTQDQDGRDVTLRDYLGKAVILYFYPRDDTPGCTTQACGFRDRFDAITAANAVVLGVSPDDAVSHRQFITKHGLPFTLLVDTDHCIADAYGVWGEKSMYGNTYMGVIRSHFVIDGAGRIAAIEYKVSPKNSIARALKAVTA